MTGARRSGGLLRAAWERSVTGRRQLALVAGEPGIGKTRLVMEFARSIAAEGMCCWGGATRKRWYRSSRLSKRSSGMPCSVRRPCWRHS